MKRNEAYTTLGLTSTATKEEAKKAFRKLAAQYHPDVNKEPSAEANFKKVNEAWQNIDADKFDDQPRSNPSQEWNHPYSWGPMSGSISLDDLLGSVAGFSRKRSRRSFAFPDVHVNQSITFKESVIGCMKEISFQRNIKCDTCDGSGEKVIDNGCATCQGKGFTITRSGMAFIHRSCGTCNGKVKSENCNVCSSKGYIAVTQAMTVNIPVGVKDGNILSLGNRGHFLGGMMGADQYSHVHLHMDVSPLEDLKIKDNDVICNIAIKLNEALQGCVKKVTTIDGMKEIIIPELSKNKDEVIIPNLGVGRRGNQVVIVNVDYPSNTKELIEFLKKE